MSICCWNGGGAARSDHAADFDRLCKEGDRGESCIGVEGRVLGGEEFALEVKHQEAPMANGRGWKLVRR